MKRPLDPPLEFDDLLFIVIVAIAIACTVHILIPALKHGWEARQAERNTIETTATSRP